MNYAMFEIVLLLVVAVVLQLQSNILELGYLHLILKETSLDMFLVGVEMFQS